MRHRILTIVLVTAMPLAAVSEERAAALAPEMRWVGKDSVSFEAAGGLGGQKWGHTSASIDEASGYYRFNVFQGTPAFGAAPNPTSANYGKGSQPTYVRFELRRGALQRARDWVDAHSRNDIEQIL